MRCIAADLERGKRVLRGKRKTEEGKLIHKTTEYVKRITFADRGSIEP